MSLYRNNHTRRDKEPVFVINPEKICLFIDGANLYDTASALGFAIDYKRLLDFFCQGSILKRAFYYTGVVRDSRHPLAKEAKYEKIRKLADWLVYNGYTVREKNVKVFRDEKGNPIPKADFDADLAIDMLLMADKCDRMILLSGDGDLRRLVEVLQMRGNRVVVASSLEARMIAFELRRQADQFIELDEIREHIEFRSDGNYSSQHDDEEEDDYDD